MKEYCIVDLDGTLIDVSERYRRMYQDFCSAYNLVCPDWEDHYTRKRLHVSDNTVFAEYNPDFSDFDLLREWKKSKIESLPYLNLDVLHKDALNFLKNLRDYFKSVFLLSLRNHYTNGFEQVENLGITGFFDEVFFAGHAEGQSPGEKKFNSIKRAIAGNNHVDENVYTGVFGDTDADQDLAEYLNLRVCLLTRGLRCRPYWDTKARSSSIVVDDLSTAFEVVKNENTTG